MAAESLVRPKTHTPGARVSNLGYRYYSPQLSRFISREPLAEHAFLSDQLRGKRCYERRRLRKEAFRPVYLFVANNPLNAVDKLGLALCLFNPTKAGCIKVQGCTTEQLEKMCLIPEDWEEGDPIGPPSNGWNCNADGLWIEGQPNWFGVPNHCQATVTCTAGGATATCCCNLAAKKLCECYNKIAKPTPPKKCDCGFFPDSGDTEHPTDYSDCFPTVTSP